MRQVFAAFLLLNVASIYLASAKTVVLIDNETGVTYNGQQAAWGQSSEDSDVINFCRMCKSYVDLFQQADETVEIRMPKEDLCDDVEENDQDLCLESIDNLHRLATFDDLSTVDNMEVCQLVSLCEEMSSSEEEYSANESDSVEETGSEQQLESNEEGIVETLLSNATHKHVVNGTHPAHHAPHPTHHHDVHSPPAHTPPPPAHSPPPPVHTPAPHHVPSHPKVAHDTHHHDPSHNGKEHPHGNGHHHNGHDHGKHNHHHKHHNGANSNAVLSSAILLFLSILISNNCRSV